MDIEEIPQCDEGKVWRSAHRRTYQKSGKVVEVAGKCVKRRAKKASPRKRSYRPTPRSAKSCLPGTVFRKAHTRTIKGVERRFKAQCVKAPVRKMRSRPPAPSGMRTPTRASQCPKGTYFRKAHSRSVRGVQRSFRAQCVRRSIRKKRREESAEYEPYEGY
jgi:hypothetical protein